MSLRDMVTGSDACTPGEGAGPSNAFAGLANTVLGTSAKNQERLKEIPGFHGLPGSSEARFAPLNPQEAALAAANGEPLQLPGLYNGVRDRQKGARLDLSQAGPSNWQDEFAQLQGDARPYSRTQAEVAPFLRAFLSTAQGHATMHPYMGRKLDLSVRDQCQIRDRSTIIARHLFVERRDQAADEQVFRLLESLRIDPRMLPNKASQEGWNDLYARTSTQAPNLGHDMALQSKARMPGSADVDRWADQFGDLDLQDGNQALVKEFMHSQAANGHNEWANGFLQEDSSRWADEFSNPQLQGAAAADRAASSKADAMQQTRALRDTLAASQDPKFQQSKFLQFVSKMSRGEIILEDNQAKEVAQPSGDNAWANEFAQRDEGLAADATFQQWAEEYDGQNAPAGWADQFHQEMHPPNAWADQFASEHSAEQWADDFASRRDQSFAQDFGAGDQEYAMAANNPFLADADSFAKGKQLFRDGLLSEARLALEAEVQRQPSNVDAWRLLGTVHAENDNDQQAIAALNKALAASPGNAEVLLSLGVSYTNELDQRRAIVFLMEWLKLQPHQQGAASVQLPKDGREKLRVVTEIFRSAVQMNHGSADAHIALGVLYNLARDFDGAVAAFRQALQTRSSDYSLWNKLGATLANSGHSSEAIDAYQKALELKPNYMRAWVNMGISQANIGQYEASIRFFGRALTLNQAATPVWGYLRSSVTCAGRDDLAQAVDDEDLDAITRAMPL